MVPETIVRRSGRARGTVTTLGRFLGRSLFPLAALVLIASTPWLGPWVVLALTALWWNVVTRVA